MSIKTRLAKLEQTAGINDQPPKQVILLADVDGIGETAAVERWKAENGPVTDNAFFIVLVAMT